MIRLDGGNPSSVMVSGAPGRGSAESSAMPASQRRSACSCAPWRTASAGSGRSCQVDRRRVAIATFLVVPVLVTRDVGPVDAVKESAVLLKETWGENIIGSVGLGFAFGLLVVCGVAIASRSRRTFPR